MPRAFLLFFYLTALWLAPTSLGAQTGSGISLSVSPNFPGPNELVLVEAIGFGFDLNNALFIWQLDNREIARGIGQKSIQFQTGLNGAEHLIQVVISNKDGAQLKRLISVRPASLELLWEATDSSVPPFYKGKPLLTEEGRVNIVAVPEFLLSGRLAQIDSLTYTWERNGKVLPSASGRGRNTLTFRKDFLIEEEEISVTVKSEDNKWTAKKSLGLSARAPFLLIYEKTPLSGIRYEEALGKRVALRGAEATFVAEPFFFSIQNKTDPSVSYTWLLNGERVEIAGDDPSTVTIRSTGERGATEINLRAAHATRLFQEAKRAFFVSFGQ